ncbi:hypothetical protein KDX27_34560 [Burkholderia cenocepacia]|uniref:DUF7682 family zinc-binding protein n=1 Tax=Burkholderia cenocepacia TaxID=95486 RepID=UPI001B98243C|nr:hypothetical protein [Burkholderia cenocepacia]MBR8172852.1 hypothetical protein [Burkholderia cenocepacia]
MKKRFECGHSGLGKFCHRCANEARPALMAAKAAEARRVRHAEAVAMAAAEVAARRAAIADESRRAAEKAAAHRSKLVAAAANAPIDLSPAMHLPAVLERALEVLGRLKQGAHPLTLGGKMLTSRRGDFSIPLGLRYRLLVDAASLKPLKFLSHENYNLLV